MTKRFRKPCGVCFENTMNRTKCGHEICYGCLTKWLKDHHTCPTCRTILKEHKMEDVLWSFCNYLLRNYDIYLLFNGSNYEITSIDVETIDKYATAIRTIIHNLHAQPLRPNTNDFMVKFIENCNANVSLSQFV